MYSLHTFRIRPYLQEATWIQSTYIQSYLVCNMRQTTIGFATPYAIHSALCCSREYCCVYRIARCIARCTEYIRGNPLSSIPYSIVEFSNLISCSIIHMYYVRCIYMRSIVLCAASTPYTVHDMYALTECAEVVLTVNHALQGAITLNTMR